MGVEVSKPVISNESRLFNFSNEGGYGGRFRFLKNITGLWLLQKCEESWKKIGSRTSPAQIIAAARESGRFDSLIRPNDPVFLNPKDMPEAIRRFCGATGQPRPKSAGETARCVFLSLAMAYREVLGQIEGVAKRKVRKIHVIGGGSQNDYLNQLTADACGLEVVAGPAEATITGNLIVQYAAFHEQKALSKAKKVFSSAGRIRNFTPAAGKTYKKLYLEFSRLGKRIR
jgi:rhamnulokinase